MGDLSVPRLEVLAGLLGEARGIASPLFCWYGAGSGPEAVVLSKGT